MPSDKQLNFEANAKAALDKRLHSLDAEVLTRLNQARQSALAAAAKPGIRIRHGWLVAGIFATATIIAAIGITLIPAQTPSPDWLTQQEEDAEVLIASEELDFYQELEFLLWLDQNNYDS